LVETLPHRGYSLVGAFGHDDCDIADAERVGSLVESSSPQVLFNAAAFTDVDGAETQVEQALRTNALGPETLARVAARAGASLVHYSTDYVFDGDLERPYDEFDQPSPESQYARTKLAGEVLARAAGKAVYVLRVGCLYGEGGRNFPSTLVDRLRRGETIRADGERLGSPTWVVAVARASAALAATGHFGLYHCTAAGETTWADYARFVANEIGVPAARVQALPTSALTMLAKRPRRAVLDNRMLRLRGLDSLGTWQDQARAFLSHARTVRQS
jgi:dTDP-4-dehydrorhamnose reductase